MQRFLILLMILGCSLLSGTESWADFEVLDVSLAASIQNREPADPVSPPAHCEKDKNGQADLPVIDSLIQPKVFFLDPYCVRFRWVYSPYLASTSRRWVGNGS